MIFFTRHILPEFRQPQILAIVHANGCLIQKKDVLSENTDIQNCVTFFYSFIAVNLLFMVTNTKKFCSEPVLSIFTFTIYLKLVQVNIYRTHKNMEGKKCKFWLDLYPKHSLYSPAP